LHHNEPVEQADVEDGLRALKQCEDAVSKEINRFKKLHQHRNKGRAIEADKKLLVETSDFKKERINKNLSVIRAAAAAHNATGIEWNVADEYPLNGCPVVQVCTDVIEPIALVGQYLLLDWEDREAKNGDIVVVETEDKRKYIRRIWKNSDDAVILEGTNPTKPSEPVFIATGKCKLRRVVGVLYDEPTTVDQNGEWSLRGIGEKWFDDIVGIRVKGTSLEPLARDGQIVLVKKKDIKANLSNDMLVCASITDIGDVIKRHFVKSEQCVLCAINQTEREVPIVVNVSQIQQAYALKGVIFETAMGKEYIT
jgi:SOS-response transcriptional repressor LexA